MLKTSILVLALTVTLANGAFAAVKQRWPDNSYNSTFPTQSDGERLFDRAKGNID